MIIGFTGKKQSGKDTAASHLVDKGWKRIAFADPMRWCLEALDPIVELGMVFGAKEDDNPHYQYTYNGLVTASGYDTAKETCPEFRRLLQVFGTEVGRNILGEYLGNIWLQIARQRIFGEQLEGNHVVITDVRFDDEAEMIRDLGGLVIEIQRGEADKAKDSHVSEKGVSRHLIDHTIQNNDSIDHLRQWVARLVKNHGKESVMETEMKGGEGSMPLELKAMNFAVVDAEDGHIVDILTTMYEDYLEAKEDGRFEFAELYKLFGHLMEVAQHVIEIANNPSDHVNALVSDIEKIYDTYVVPIDFPGVGPIVERWGKSKVRELIRPGIEALLENKVG